MKSRFLQICIAVLSLTLTPIVAYADPLDDAKAAGQVGEQLNGYLGIVAPSAPPAVKALVTDINAKRRVAYMDIMKKNGQPLNVVETLAGQKLVERTPSGEFYQNASGAWVKK